MEETPTDQVARANLNSHSSRTIPPRAFHRRAQQTQDRVPQGVIAAGATVEAGATRTVEATQTASVEVAVGVQGNSPISAHYSCIAMMAAMSKCLVSLMASSAS